ncbi:MAG: hypothetical protein LW708_20785 [Anabaena sp. 49628_E55]|nr:hypothetical protein [Anabaena sp. 49628_E55]
MREGSRHSWWWNPEKNRRSAIPRHQEIDDILAKTTFSNCPFSRCLCFYKC